MYLDEPLSLLLIAFAIYGFYTLIKNVATKVKNISTKDDEEVRISEESKQNIFGSLKIFFVGVIIAVLLYMTPILNETVKIIVSLAITLGALGSAFLLNEEEDEKSWLRPVLFMGQMFFGITMFLMLVNTNMGYSEFSIFLIWAIFNFFIAKHFGNIENKILFIITLLTAIVIGVSRYALRFDTSILAALISISLLAMQIFADSKKIGIHIVQNVLITLLMFTYISYITNRYGEIVLDDKVMLGISIIFLIATFGIEIFVNKLGKVNLKSFAIYLPLIAVIFLVGTEAFEEDMLFVFELLNIAIATWLLADNSIYKKVLTSIILLLLTIALLDVSYLDAVGKLVILASTGLAFVFLLEPKKVIKEADKNEEE